MITYANQRIIKIKRDEAGENEPCLKVSIDSIKEACQKITNLSEMKVWLYLVSKDDGEDLAFSSKDASEATGLSANSIREGINSLIKKGFITEALGKSENRYVFREVPSDYPVLDFIME